MFFDGFYHIFLFVEKIPIHQLVDELCAEFTPVKLALDERVVDTIKRKVQKARDYHLTTLIK